jgi:hypothetical protein
VSNVQTAALKNVTTMISQALAAGGQGTGLMAGAPASITGAAQAVGQAAGVMGNVAGSYGTIAQQKYKAEQATELSFGNLLKMITSLGTALGSGLGANAGVAEVFGKGGGAASAGGTAGSTDVGGYDALMGQSMEAGGFGAAAMDIGGEAAALAVL